MSSESDSQVVDEDDEEKNIYQRKFNRLNRCMSPVVQLCIDEHKSLKKS